MNSTLYVMLASWAATGQVPAAAHYSGQPRVQQVQYVMPQQTPWQAFCGRMRAFFQGGQPSAGAQHRMQAQPRMVMPAQQRFVQPGMAPVQRAAVTTKEPPLMDAHGIRTAGASVPGEPQPAVDVKDQDRVGHETDYSWITGRLFYVHADGGRWTVRYALPDEVDRYGGSVVLAPGVEMRNFREGDLVCVTGEVLHPGPTSAHLAGALYRANTISLVERADP